MKPWIARRLCDACGALEFADDYSGRGMSGTETGAVTGTVANFAYAVARVASVMGPDDLPPEFQEQFLDAMRSVRTDSMGREVVFY